MDWREKISYGDIAEASRTTGIAHDTYQRSLKLPPEKWTPAMVKINKAIKDTIEEREAIRAEFINQN